MDADDFADMVRAKLKIDEERFDEKMQILSWQTSILINAMGKSKQRYKPKDLYKPISNGTEETVNGSYTVISEQDKERLQRELLETFKDSL